MIRRLPIAVPCAIRSLMKRLLPCLFASIALAPCFQSFAAESDGEIPPPKDEPRVIDPGPPPSDAIVLFNGKDLKEWEDDRDGSEAKWEIQPDGAVIAKVS